MSSYLTKLSSVRPPFFSRASFNSLAMATLRRALAARDDNERLLASLLPNV